MNMEVPENDMPRRARVRTITRATSGVAALLVVAGLALSMVGASGHKTVDVANGRGRAATEYQSLIAKRNKASATVTFNDRIPSLNRSARRILSQDGRGRFSEKFASGTLNFYDSRDDKLVVCAPQPPDPRPICEVDAKHSNSLKDVDKTLSQWTDAIARDDASLRFTTEVVAGHPVMCASRTSGSQTVKTCLDRSTGVVLASTDIDDKGRGIDSEAVSVTDAKPSDFMPPTAGKVLRITADAGGALAFVPPILNATTGMTEIDVTTGAPGHTFGFQNPELHFAQVPLNTPGSTSKTYVFFSKPGDYEFSCSVPGHAAAGDSGVVHVTGPEQSAP